ncbi:SAPS-domain-containing protein, partial [Testicularia cyperi]
WRFGFSSVSTLETLLDKPNVTLEDVLDEEDLLQECKSQNQKLINYLRQPRIVKRLMEHVVGTATVGSTGNGGKEWEEKVKFKYPYVASEVLSCNEIWPIVDAIFSDTNEFLVPFWNAVLTIRPTPSQAPLPMHSHPLFADSAAQAPGTPASASSTLFSASTNAFSFSSSASSSASLSGRSDSESSHGDNRLRATCALDNGPGRGVLAGYWAKVNGAYLERKPAEMIRFIKQQPRIIERFVAHLETPAVVDLLFRIIQMEETIRSPDSQGELQPEQQIDIINWLASQDLISRTVELLAPNYSIDVHNTVSELLKAIIALSAPSPAALNQGQVPELGGTVTGDGFGGQQDNPTGINNRLVRELASETIVRKMVGYMLDSQMPRQLHRRLTDVADEQLAQLSSADLKSVKPSSRGAPAALDTLPEHVQPSGEDSALDDDDDDDDESFARPLNPREFPASESRSPGLPDHRDSTATLRPDGIFPPVSAPTVPVTAETCSSTLVTCIGVFIELIRKNNSDYFEQHLLRTLHNHLVKRQGELTEKRLQKQEEAEAVKTSAAVSEGSTTQTPNGAAAAVSGAAATGITAATTSTDEADNLDEEEEEDVQGMEEAMSEIVDKMGLVHLGPMLRVLSERLGDFQQLVNEPRDRSSRIPTSVGELTPLTFERYRITELYAELLHCSNMALLNRGPGEGPEYSADGVLMGGLDGLQTLARTLQGGDGPEIGDLSAAAEVTGRAETKASTKTKEGELLGAGASSQAAPQLSVDHPGHGRDKSSTGASTDATDEAEDEALLNEVSLSDKQEAPASGVDKEAKVDTASPTEAEAEATPAAPAASTFTSLDSTLGGLSLAELTSPRLSGPPSPVDEGRDYVVGDLLKKKFLECGILPSLLDLFFEYPWNNFLHNVVYDILQQCFNGRMDTGLNRKLTVAVFEQGNLTSRIVEGRSRNEESMAGPRRIRLGFMGHMNLIAEETVKLLERYPLEIARPVQSFTERDEWQNVVSETLEEIREKEGGPLAFNRANEGTSMSFGSGTDDDDDTGLGGGVGGAGSSSFASYLSSQLGGGGGAGSDDDDDDDDDSDDEASWLSSEMKRVASGGAAGSGDAGFDDVFAPHHGGQGGSGELGDDDDDDWGPFADPTDSGDMGDDASGAAQTFDFTSGSGASMASNPFAENLTPADWSAQFRREYHDEDGVNGANDEDEDDEDEGDGDDDDTRNAHETDSNTIAGEQALSKSPSATSTGSKDGDTPFVDLLDPSKIRSDVDVVAKAHARRPSLSKLEAPDSSALRSPPSSSPVGLGHGRRASLSGESTTLSEVTTESDPLGPGIPTEVEQNKDGRLQRTLADGSTVVVPLDEVALGAA